MRLIIRTKEKTPRRKKFNTSNVIQKYFIKYIKSKNKLMYVKRVKALKYNHQINVHTKQKGSLKQFYQNVIQANKLIHLLKSKLLLLVETDTGVLTTNGNKQLKLIQACFKEWLRKERNDVREIKSTPIK